MAQVKFYSVSALPETASTTGTGGVYFVDGGELYKGTQRFGLGRVTVDAEFDPSTSTKAGQARGDIVVTGAGAGWVFDGEHWQSIGGDTVALQTAWQADISTWTAGLASGATGSYIEYIEQAADGKVTAHAAPFNTKVLEAVGNGSASGSGNGITVSVVTTSGSVTGVEVSASQISCDTVTANTGNFTNLNVSDTATFSATTVSATTLTIGGSTVEQLADKQIAAISESYASGNSNGISVSVTTSGGNVTGVTVNAGTFGNVMHFVGAGTTLPASAEAGDVYVFTANATDESGYKVGQEVVYTGSAWEVIGDQNTYAVNAYSHGEEVVTAAATTLPDAVHAIAAGFDTLKSKVDAYVGGTSTSADQGVSVEVSINSTTLAPSVTVDVTPATLFADLDADVSSSENSSILVSVTQVDGSVTQVQADLLWLGADGTALA